MTGVGRGPDHPRSRGEYPSVRGEPVRPRGSSPLSRGILVEAVLDVVEGGIIPALAGNTVAGMTGVGRGPDHPRSRGEYSDETGWCVIDPGSSPLSRGIPTFSLTGPRGARIIPALAGNTTTCTDPTGCTRDHPRSRGEYSGNSFPTSTNMGSSPLSRGIRHQNTAVQLPPRIIPALAGNTSTTSTRSCSTKDHPRSRGEYGTPPAPPPSGKGSSPLSRGILGLDAGLAVGDRIIPALAGNTSTSPSTYSDWWDHPRSRGEYWVYQFCSRYTAGSSPLSRGIQLERVAMAQRHRIIPALAGNTCLGVSTLGPGGDHPRSRGEYRPGRLQGARVGGSSPLSRGIHARPRRE